MGYIEVTVPVRISFVGGGTDIPYFYNRYGGAVISTTIDKYITITVESNKHHKIIIDTPNVPSGEPSHESVYHVPQVSNPIIRTALYTVSEKYGWRGTSISVTSDIRAQSGLGSSSALMVGLIMALREHKDDNYTPRASDIAREAAEAEMIHLGSPIGKQDHYIAAYGGLCRFGFLKDDTVEVTRLIPPPSFEEHLMLFDTGISRSANKILDEQKKQAPDEQLISMKGQVDDFHMIIENHATSNLDAIGELLHEGWMLKRSLSDYASSGHLDNIYSLARQAGAIGGKILGAGGGGYFLFYVPPKNQDEVKSSLSLATRHVPFKLSDTGASTKKR